ncbi:DUF4158 domain-containing protein [Trichormus azollae]|jgi:hypothetical protein|uniref:DUF4158 domain-containing protein n=1 Tax=Trichormus azollae TaxID=1164 RepID=UPI0001958019|nr:DUF4158 domain-containing protein [Trichormus azollae]
MLNLIDVKLKVIKDYGVRDTTRWDHLAEIQQIFGYVSFSISHYKKVSKWLMRLAWSMDKGIALVKAMIEEMRRCQIILPSIFTVGRLGWETRRGAQENFYWQLTQQLTPI